LSHVYIKCIILPRQARDKHRENSKKDRLLQAEGDRKAEPGYGHDRVAERWAEISPLHIIEESLAITTGSAAPPPPPSLVLFGESDPLVPVHT
jgi:hypothetical protein